MRMKATSNHARRIAPAGSLRRRDVLALGSAAAVAVWLDGFSGVTEAAGEDLAAGRPLSVGYVRGSDRWPDLRTQPWSRSGQAEGAEPVEVVPIREAAGTAALPAGPADRALVTVRGLYPAVPSTGETVIRSINLDILYPAAGGGSEGAYLPFFAWSYSRGSVSSASPPVRFAMPIDERGLLVALTVDPADPAALSSKASRRPGLRTSPDARLTSSLAYLGPGGPLVTRGVYLLGVGTRAWDRGAVLQPRLDALDPYLLSVVVTIDPLPAEVVS